ncbi:MAG: AAA family ATPase [Agathobacter sp.]
MGINENTKNLIDALAKNDTTRAKAYAKCIIANDSSEKNRRWREKTSVLLKTGDEKDLELPTELYSICELVKPGKDFAAERYYLPEAEVPVVEEIIRKQEIVQRMQVLGIPTVNTTLLYGEPGTGKTELAKYIAYKLEKPILLLRFSNLIDSYMGVTGKNIGKVFDDWSPHTRDFSRELGDLFCCKIRLHMV